MKNIIKVLSYLAIFIATILFITVCSGVLNTTQETHSISPSPSPSIQPKTTLWQDFPINKTQNINFKIDDKRGFNRLTDREKKDQLRDWLLLTITSDKTLTADNIGKSLYDVFPIRYGYMKPVSNFEYGDTRSVYIGEGKIVALLPKGIIEKKILDDLAEIFDKHRQNLNNKLKTIDVFEYELYPNNQASLTRTKTLKADELLTEKSGYFEAQLKTQNDLKNLLEKIDDITFAQVNGSSLTVGGRKIRSHSYSGISVEDIAAIWQSEKEIREHPKNYRGVDGSGFSLDPYYDYKGLQAELEKVKPLLQSLKVDGKPILTEAMFKEASEYLAKKDKGISSYDKFINKIGNNIEKNSTALNREKKQEKDTYIKQRNAKIKQEEDTYIKQRNAKIKQEEENFLRQLKQEGIEEINLAKKANLPPEEINKQIEQIIQSKKEKFKKFQSEVDKKELANYNALKNAIAKRETANLTPILKREKADFDNIDRFLAPSFSKRYQSARYDGDLQGTEVGMVLFYTDLLAKLWALDYQKTIPSEQISDFKPLTEINANISSIYKQEIDTKSNTRLWFSPQDKGFQFVDNPKSIIFARNATRVNAKSSENGIEKETTPTAGSAAFLGWWNEHYQEIAAYETQYQKLNEIMKWSILISKLNVWGQTELLSFLQGVKVRHDYHFYDWVQAKKKQLKFKNWDSDFCKDERETNLSKPVCFYKEGYQGRTTETMPPLSSKEYIFFGKSYAIFGGVSLAEKGKIQERPSLPQSPEISELSLRSDLNYDPTKSKETTLTTLDGTIYALGSINTSEVSSTAKAVEGTKFRSPDAELGNSNFTQSVSRTADGIEINTKVDNTDLGNFSTNKTKNGFEVGWESRDIDAGQSLVFELSSSGKNIEEFLISHPTVESIAKRQQGDLIIYYIKQQNSESWLRLESGGGGGSEGPPPGTVYMAEEPPQNPRGPGKPFVAPPGDKDKKYKLAWKDDEEVRKQLADNFLKCVNKNCQKILLLSQIRRQRKQENEPGYKEFQSNLEKNNYPELAEQLVIDKLEFVKNSKKYLKVQLEKIDNHIRDNKYESARRLVEQLILKYGNQPDLIFRKVLIEIHEGRINIQRMVLKNQPDPHVTKKTFFDEVNHLISRKKRNFRLIKFTGDNSYVYIQDDPGLNNIDWSQPIEASLPFTSSTTRVYQLQDGQSKLGDMGFGDGSGGSGGSGGNGGNGGNGGKNPTGTDAEYPGKDPFSPSFKPIPIIVPFCPTNNQSSEEQSSKDNQPFNCDQITRKNDNDKEFKIYVVFQKL